MTITDRGKPIAQLQPLDSPHDLKNGRPRWKDRVLRPGFAALINEPVGGINSTEILSADRDRLPDA